MSGDKKLKSSEMVYRGLVRLPSELTTRPAMDENGFLRRKLYKKSGKPENGISVFRKDKFPTLQDLWERLQMRNPVGLSEYTVRVLQAKGLKLVISGPNSEHISVRCVDCDMRELLEICKPAGSKDFFDCPLFDVDTYDLEAAFQLVEAPAVRVVAKKPKQR
ncbi:MAG: hypothetical protein JST01_09880 [Cyanobacteria bacterium SZAS TMP-1]|nr:hypothetical protein [Cyanobacteria bacterium SZAS TMP-1]